MAGRLPSAAWCVGKAIEGAAADAQGRNPSHSFDFPFFFFFGGVELCVCCTFDIL